MVPVLCALLAAGAVVIVQPAHAKSSRADAGETGARKGKAERKAPHQASKPSGGGEDDPDSLGDGEDPGTEGEEQPANGDPDPEEAAPAVDAGAAAPPAAVDAGVAADAGAPVPVTPATAAPLTPLQRAQASVKVTRGSYVGLRQHWETRQKNPTAASTAEFVDVFRDMGGGAPGGGQVPAMALALLLEADEAQGQGQPERALGLAEAAAFLAPSVTVASLKAARARLAQDPADVHGWWEPLRRALLMEGSDLSHQVRWLYALSVGLAGMLAALLLALAVVRGGRSWHRYLHDAAHWVPEPFRGFTSVVLALALLALPLVLGVGVLGASLWWLTLTWGYLEGRVRWAAVAAAVASLGIPWLLSLAGLALAYPGSDAEQLWRAQTELDRPEAGLPAPRTAESTLAMGIRGLVLKRMGEVPDAVRIYKDAVNADPKNPWLRVNLGCAMGATGDLDRALREFERATEVDAQDVRALHNAANIHQLLLRTGAARDAYDEAARHDARLAAGLRARSMVTTPVAGEPITPRSHNVLLVDAPASAAALLPLVLTPSPLSEQLSEQLWNRLSPRLNVLGYSVVVLGLLLVWSLLALLHRRVAPARGCPRCGEMVCGDCMAGETDGVHCPVCVSIQSRATRGDSAVKVRKEAQIVRYKRRRRVVLRTLALVLPGVGHLLAGATVAGTLLWSLWSLGLATAWAAAGGLPDPLAVGSSAAAFRALLGALPLVLAYLVAIPTALRLER